MEGVRAGWSGRRSGCGREMVLAFWAVGKKERRRRLVVDDLELGDGRLAVVGSM